MFFQPSDFVCTLSFKWIIAKNAKLYIYIYTYISWWSFVYFTFARCWGVLIIIPEWLLYVWHHVWEMDTNNWRYSSDGWSSFSVWPSSSHGYSQTLHVCVWWKSLIQVSQTCSVYLCCSELLKDEKCIIKEFFCIHFCRMYNNNSNTIIASLLKQDLLTQFAS